MEFDFYSKYQQLDNEHLLDLVAVPAKMQAPALEAALKVLTERGVTNQEIEERQQAHRASAISAAQYRKERKKLGLFNYVESTFFQQDLSWDFEEEDIPLSYSQDERRNIIRKLLMLLVVPALQTIVVLIAIISLFWIAIGYQTFNGVLFFNLFILLLSLSIVLTIAWFLLKRKKNAWSATVIYTVYYVGNHIFTLYQLLDVGFDFVSPYQLAIYLIMIPVGTYSIYLLNTKSIMNAFELTRKRIENTWIIAIILPLVLFFIIYLYS